MLSDQPANRPAPGTAVVSDKGLSGEETETFFASPDLGLTLIRSARNLDAEEPARPRSARRTRPRRPVGPHRPAAARPQRGDLAQLAHRRASQALGGVRCAAGVCDQHAPGPGNPGGVQGLVFNMSTDPRCRRHGYARACLDALLAWFRAETEARVINLNTTGDGIALYRSAGFTEPRYPVLQLRLEGPRR